MQYDVITAISGYNVTCMFCGEENRLFALLFGEDVIKLDTSSTTFAKVKIITMNGSLFIHLYILCYVPDPHRLLVHDQNEAHVVSCDDKKSCGE